MILTLQVKIEIEKRKDIIQLRVCRFSDFVLTFLNDQGYSGLTKGP